MMAFVEDPTAPSHPSPPVGPPPARGWAVPGSAEAQPQPEPAVGAVPGWGVPTDGHAGRPVSAAGDAVPRVALRPMTAADILDGGFSVIKARPARIVAITAAFVVPTQLIAAYLQRDSSAGIGFADVLSEDPTLFNEQTASADPTGQIVAAVLVTVIPAIALVCVAAAVAHLVSQWLMGHDAPAGEMLGVVGRRWWPLLGSFVVVKVAEGLGALGCYIGIVFVMALFVPVAPIIGVEGGGPLKAVARSCRLAATNYFRTLGLAVLMAIVATLLGYALSALPQLLALWFGLEDAWPLLALGSVVSQVIVLPFVAASTVLLYLDLRVRSEGLDLEMTAVDVLDRAA